MSTTPGIRSTPRQHTCAHSTRATVALASLSAFGCARAQHEARKSSSQGCRHGGTGASLEGQAYTKVSEACVEAHGGDIDG